MTDQMARRRVSPAHGLLAFAAALILLFGWYAWRRQPGTPLELKLTLVKTRLRPHDGLWYVLEIKNVGRKAISNYDKFWYDQTHLAKNQEWKLGTFFEARTVDGKEIAASFGWAGMHGEYDFWTNPPFKDPSFHGDGFWMEGGQTVFASPSIPSAIRDRNLEDMRRGPPGGQQEWMEFQRREQQAGSQRNWPGWVQIPAERPAWVPAKARILTGFHFPLPGRYRIRAVYEPLDKQWLHDERMRERFPPGTKVFRFESPWVDFEVVP